MTRKLTSFFGNLENFRWSKWDDEPLMILTITLHMSAQEGYSAAIRACLVFAYFLISLIKFPEIHR